MKKYLTDFLSAILPLVLIVMHHLTGHYAWIFVLGTFIVIAILMLIISEVIVALVYYHDVDDKFSRQVAKANIKHAPMSILSYGIMMISIVYLLYIESYFISSAYLVMIGLILLMRLFFKVVRKEIMEKYPDDFKTVITL